MSILRYLRDTSTAATAAITSQRMNVRRGTPLHHGESLCESCRSGMTVIGTGGLDEDQHYCHKLGGEAPRRMTMKVAACTGYDDKRLPSIYDMRQIAWELRTDKSGRKIGFLSPADRREQQQQQPAGDSGAEADPLFDPLKQELI